MSYSNNTAYYGPTTRKIKQGTTTFVGGIEDLPAPVAGIITLAALSTWVIVADVDLGSARIECDGVTSIVGFGQETCKLRSTGLPAAAALITSAYTTTLRSIGLYADDGRTCIRIDGTGEPQFPALDWFGVNFNEGNVSPGKAGELTNVANSINLIIGAFGDGFYVDGSIGTLGFDNSILTANDGKYAIKIEPTATITSRLRMTSCSIVAGPAGATGLDVPKATITNAEGFVLELCSLVGGGTRVTGTTEQDDEARWIENRGIANTTRVGEMEWSGNALVTTIAVAGTYVKLNGVSAAGNFNQHFTHDTSGKLTYTSELSGTFAITITASLTGTNNRVVAVQAYKDNSPANSHVTRSTTNGAGRAESIFYQAIVQLNQGNYIEVFGTNLTDTNSITAEDMTIQIKQI